MKTRYLAPLAAAIALAGCQQSTAPVNVVKVEQKVQNTANNPFFTEYDTPYGIPPFDNTDRATAPLDEIP